MSVPTGAAGRLSRLLKQLCATRQLISDEDAAATAVAVLFEQRSEGSNMFRTVFSQVLFRLNRLSARHFSAAAIPAPNTQPDVHYSKVGGLSDLQLDMSQLRNQQVCVCVCARARARLCCCCRETNPYVERECTERTQLTWTVVVSYRLCGFSEVHTHSSVNTNLMCVTAEGGETSVTVWPKTPIVNYKLEG